MVVSIDFIKERLQKELPEITALKKQHKILRMHYTGIGKTEYLEKISGLENSAQLDLRKKYARSNKDLFANLTSPVDKIFSAKGKNKIYNIKDPEAEKKFRRTLSTINNGQSLEKWLQSYWKDKVVVDPNGLFMIELSEDGDPYPTYKSILSIRDYKQKGSKVEYIIFEPCKKEENGTVVEYVRVYDDIGDTLYRIGNGSLVLVDDKSFGNPWGEVPGVIISDIEDTMTGFKRSTIDNEVELADEYLRDNSVKTIYKFAHGFPLFWMYLAPCSNCKGVGQKDGKDCTVCNGTGYSIKKDVSDILGITPPKDPDDVRITPDIAGYITPPSENLDQMTSELSLLKDMMWFSQWGTIIERGENETATGRFIDVQPVSDKLNVYSDSLENIETILVNYIGKYEYIDSYTGSSINYGRRFMIETPDQLINKYIDGKKEKLNQSTLNYLLRQYYQSQFANDNISLTYYLKLMELEAWVHLTLDEVPEVYRGTVDYDKKVYLNQWLKTVKIDYVITKDLKTLDKELTKFVKQKQKDNDKSTRQPAATV